MSAGQTEARATRCGKGSSARARHISAAWARQHAGKGGSLGRAYFGTRSTACAPEREPGELTALAPETRPLNVPHSATCSFGVPKSLIFLWLHVTSAWVRHATAPSASARSASARDQLTHLLTTWCHAFRVAACRLDRRKHKKQRPLGGHRSFTREAHAVRFARLTHL